MRNYLDDAIGVTFTKSSDYKVCSNDKKNCLVRATVCGKCYRDPDAVSEKLYNDLCIVFNNSDWGTKNKLVKKGGSSQWYLQYDENPSHQLTSDYIGPSRINAFSFLNGNEKEKASQIGKFLLISRTIGGHIFWPAHRVNRKRTINQTRGNNGLYDRIDIALAELQHFYNTKGEETGKYSQPLYDAFKRYKWFFDDCFGSFEKYINCMKLNMFLQDGNVISLADSDIKNGVITFVSNEHMNYKPTDYSRFIENCTKLIKIRSDEMNQFLNNNIDE